MQQTWAQSFSKSQTFMHLTPASQPRPNKWLESLGRTSCSTGPASQPPTQVLSQWRLYNQTCPFESPNITLPRPLVVQVIVPSPIRIDQTLLQIHKKKNIQLDRLYFNLDYKIFGSTCNAAENITNKNILFIRRGKKMLGKIS